MLFRRQVLTPTLTYHVLQWQLDKGKDPLNEMWTPGKWVAGDTARLTAGFAVLRRLHYLLDPFSRSRREVVAQDILHLLWETRYVLSRITDPLMEQAADLMRTQAGEMISMQDISSQVGLGPVQFTRRFHKAYGVNPIEFLTRHRLKTAQKMLIGTTQTIDEIAMQCGWSHGSYLSRIFTQHFGIALGEFRKQRRV